VAHKVQFLSAVVESFAACIVRLMLIDFVGGVSEVVAEVVLVFWFFVNETSYQLRLLLLGCDHVEPIAKKQRFHHIIFFK